MLYDWIKGSSSHLTLTRVVFELRVKKLKMLELQFNFNKSCI